MTIAVILDISPDSGYPNLCTRLGTAHHREPFRHTSVDRCIGEREEGREQAREGRVTFDALPKRDGWNEGLGREIVTGTGRLFGCATMARKRARTNERK